MGMGIEIDDRWFKCSITGIACRAAQKVPGNLGAWQVLQERNL